ncbi:disease resistance protein RGA2-like [Typha latifolia]|uniref:disease resistance protein RGA2-like n=1 Tax=Typha latifolia TaxID=4733 RepID=UPI003C2DD030
MDGATELIRKVVAMARSLLRNNHYIHRPNGLDFLDELELLLPRITAAADELEAISIRELKESGSESSYVIAMRRLLRQLKDAAYDAEDVLEDLELETGKFGCYLLCSSDGDHDLRTFEAVRGLLLFDDRIKRTLDKLFAMVDAIERPTTTTSWDSRHTISFVFEHMVFGRQKELDTILRYIRSGTDLGVIAIAGMGGVGKTTVAQLVYNDPFVKEYFALQGWIHVTRDSDAGSIMEEMVASFERRFDGVTDYATVRRRLAAHLAKKRYLLVLDDVWDEVVISTWSDLLPALAQGAPGSIILVTTQSKKVARTTATTTPVVLGVLPWDDLWSLFKYYAFYGSEIGSREEKLLPIGEKIAKNLFGLPLAAKVFGKILARNFDENLWKKYTESDICKLKEGSYSILSPLRYGYQQLHAGLKKCFCYCSLFPKGYRFEKDKLVQMWIAQGFVQSKDSTHLVISLEDIGRQWFDELEEKFFLQPTSDGGKYTMHDLMRELAFSVSSDEFSNFGSEDIQVLQIVRHLAVQNTMGNAIGNIYDCKDLRTLILMGHYDHKLDGFLKKSTSLRVLDLSGIDMGITKELLQSISLLKHLCFLDLSFTKIRQLPESVCSLYHLQVLGLQGCKFKKLPKGITKLINLRHLYADGTTISLISRIGRLTNIQEIEEFRVRNKEGHRIRELKDLNELRKLCIMNLQKVVSKKEATEAKLMNKEHLDTLALRWNSKTKSASGKNMEVIEGLQPNMSLKELMIDGYQGTALPSWILQNLTNLQSLHLRNCLTLATLPPIGKLSALKSLSVEGLNSVEFIGDQLLEVQNLQCLTHLCTDSSLLANNLFLMLGKLPSLQSLKVCKCSDIVEFSAQHEVWFEQLTSLEELEFSDCHNLRSLPSTLASLSSMKKLTLSNCPCIDSLPEYGLPSMLEELHLFRCSDVLVQRCRPEEGIYWPNICHIPYIKL